eukprot:CAMPEP_0172443934 /NCGR_PEP_ID=MMETSP1065-20121228/4112_1 /TAXON_ID=265537 /ORGANISM="Amphiprora paludosa, Strain CCMP125" /LENGTH=279 /DNA_ID=CAMNT_0013194339 /DNA_START=177 /DNA_END=1016 /DNA_ORIENTATION=+
MTTGTWQCIAETNPDSTNDDAWPVEEVMRSCGGAVQGVNEIPMTTATLNKEEEYSRMYLNRANDEFLIMNDGASYTCRVVSQKQQEQSISTTLTSLTLPTANPPRRLLVQEQQPSSDATRITTACLLDRVSSSSSLTTNSDNTQPSLSLITADNNLPQVTWNRHIRCRMPSPSMPWMVQRLKWEVATVEEKEALQSLCWNGNIDIVALNGQDKTSLWNDAVLVSPSSSTISTVRAIRQDTNAVLCISREYSDNNTLLSVVWSQGKLITSDSAQANGDEL